MVSISDKDPLIYSEFLNGNFVVLKSSHIFSATPIDQAHEQINEKIKGAGGITGVTENQEAL